MSTKSGFKWSEINAKNPIFSCSRVTIETAFYGNNVEKVDSLTKAYELAYNSPGTVVTDIPVYGGEMFGLPDGAKVLLFNDGNVSARAASARRIATMHNVHNEFICGLVRESIYKRRMSKLYHTETYIGLDPDFMVKAHLLLPENEENLMYSWMLNFQVPTDQYDLMYEQSLELENEGDIFVYADPQWSHPDFPMGLAYFDPLHNCAAILGMRYFGELKKGTLTLAWGIASRFGRVPCHGGQKCYKLGNNEKFVVAAFGLSGSGKSTITHARHGGKFDITILHDDAFVISIANGSSVALEPSYFDKTQDYPMTSYDTKFLVTVQNNAVTKDKDGKIVLLTEDLRSGNGRAIKSRLWSPNRVDKFNEPINAIFWLMKDPTLPPIVKLTDSKLASAMGATLATKRSSAERLPDGVDKNALVIESYANPFRTYPLAEDYVNFRNLIEGRGVDCYILNTGDFWGKKITPETTLSCIEKIVEKKDNFVKWHNFDDIEIMEVEGFVPDFSDSEYKDQFQKRISDRIEFVKSRDTAIDGFDALPQEVLDVLQKVLEEV